KNGSSREDGTSLNFVGSSGPPIPIQTVALSIALSMCRGVLRKYCSGISSKAFHHNRSVMIDISFFAPVLTHSSAMSLAKSIVYFQISVTTMYFYLLPYVSLTYH